MGVGGGRESNLVFYTLSTHHGVFLEGGEGGCIFEYQSFSNITYIPVLALLWLSVPDWSQDGLLFVFEVNHQ